MIYSPFQNALHKMTLSISTPKMAAISIWILISEALDILTHFILQYCITKNFSSYWPLIQSLSHPSLNRNRTAASSDQTTQDHWFLQWQCFIAHCSLRVLWRLVRFYFEGLLRLTWPASLRRLQAVVRETLVSAEISVKGAEGSTCTILETKRSALGEVTLGRPLDFPSGLWQPLLSQK